MCWNRIASSRIEVRFEDVSEDVRQIRVVRDQGPAAVALPIGREARIPEVLRADPRDSRVDDRVLRVEVSVPFHDVGTASEPSDFDARSQQTAYDAMLVLFDTPDGRAVQEDPDMHLAFGRRREDGCDPFALERVHTHLDCRASGAEQAQEREIARIGGEDRGRRTLELHRARVEGGLT